MQAWAKEFNMNFKVIFKLDGTGVYFYPHDPIHLDALLAWALAPMQANSRNISRSDVPDDINLPLLRSKINDSEVWHASALFCNNEQESLRFWRKKFRQNYQGCANGSPNLTNGIYREWNMPVPLILTNEMYAYASGNRKEVKRLLKRHIKSLGKKRSQGFGKIVDIETIEQKDDWSVAANGVAMRYYPHADGTRLVRPCPPYWNNHDAVRCLNVGDRIF